MGGGLKEGGLGGRWGWEGGRRRGRRGGLRGKFREVIVRVEVWGCS